MSEKGHALIIQSRLHLVVELAFHETNRFIPRLSKSDRTGRSDRLNREPDLGAVRLVRKTVPQENREKM
jgi:hypothetical protein